MDDIDYCSRDEILSVVMGEDIVQNKHPETLNVSGCFI